MPIEKGAFLIRYLYGASYLYPPPKTAKAGTKNIGAIIVAPTKLYALIAQRNFRMTRI